MRYLGRIKKTYGQHHHRYLSCLFLTLWKVVVFFCSMIVIEHFVTGKVGDLFTKFYSGFQRHDNTIIEMNSVLGINYFLSNQQKGTSEAMSIGSVPYAAIYTFLVQSVASLLCYMAAKFASKIRIQRLSMALPLNLVVPVSITLLVTLCKLKLNNVCMFNDFIPSYLFWNCPDGSYLAGILDDDYGWLWMLWLVSQSWITKHNWTPRCIRLALTERLFVHPYYNGLLIDQSVAMNRRRDDDSEEIVWSKDEPANADEDDMEKSDAKLKGSALTGAEYPTTRVYICATMWHETKSEMATFFKSIFGLDEEYRIRKKLKSTSSLKVSISLNSIPCDAILHCTRQVCVCQMGLPMHLLHFCLFEAFRMHSVIQESKIMDQFSKFSRIFSKKKEKKKKKQDRLRYERFSSDAPFDYFSKLKRRSDELSCE